MTGNDGLHHRQRGTPIANVDYRTIVCDFCSAPAPHWVFQLPPFRLDASGRDTLRSLGTLSFDPFWAACDQCRLAVENGEWEHLQTRVEAYVEAKLTSGLMPIVRDPGRKLLDTFRALYKEHQPPALMIPTRARHLQEMVDALRHAIIAGRIPTALEGIPIEVMAEAMALSDDDLMTYLGRGKGQQIEQAIERAFHAMNANTLPAGRPWMVALERHYETLHMLQRIVQGAEAQHHELASNWRMTLGMLTRAETYAWYGDALQAVLEAAKSVPTDVPLTLDMVPGIGHGFWWMTPALNVSTTDKTPTTPGLLWSVTGTRGEKGPDSLTVSAIADDYQQHGHQVLIPTTGFRWGFGETLDEAFARSGVEYDQSYPPGSDAPHNRERTMAAIAQFMRFLLAGFAWLQQDILHTVEGHVQRHRRKQLKRELKLDRDVPHVKVIALRRSHYEHTDAAPVTQAPETTETRHYTCQWVVRGHWRNVACGPGRTDHRLRFIHPYIAGPDDKPLRTQRKVFAVVR